MNSRVTVFLYFFFPSPSSKYFLTTGSARGQPWDCLRGNSFPCGPWAPPGVGVDLQGPRLGQVLDDLPAETSLILSFYLFIILFWFHRVLVPGGGNSNSLQYSCLENPTDRGAWWATVHGVAKSWTGLTERTEQVLAVARGVSFYCITRALSLQHTSDLQTLQLWPTGSVAPKHVRF